MQNQLHKAAIKIKLFICVSNECVVKFPSCLLDLLTFEALFQHRYCILSMLLALVRVRRR